MTEARIQCPHCGVSLDKNEMGDVMLISAGGETLGYVRVFMAIGDEPCNSCNGPIDRKGIMEGRYDEGKKKGSNYLVWIVGWFVLVVVASFISFIHKHC